jgi:hypothetical protein
VHKLAIDSELLWVKLRANYCIRQSGLRFVRVVSDICPCTDPTRHYSVQEAARGRPDTTTVGRISGLSGPEVTSEDVCPIPTEIYVGCLRFDLTRISEMGNCLFEFNLNGCPFPQSLP